MREHVFKESDVNKDRMISYEEFLQETKRDEFDAPDPGWNTLDEDEEELYTDEEFQTFEHDREEQIRKMQEAGQLPQGYPYPYGQVPGMPMDPRFQQHGMPVDPRFQQGMGGMGDPRFAPMPGVGPNGVPMHGSVPGQPAGGAYPQPPQFAGQPQQQFQQQFQPGHPQQFAPQPGQPQQFAGQPQPGQPQQFAPQPGQPQQQFAAQQGQPPQPRVQQQQPQPGAPQQPSGQPQPRQKQPEQQTK